MLHYVIAFNYSFFFRVFLNLLQKREIIDNKVLFHVDGIHMAEKTYLSMLMARWLTFLGAFLNKHTFRMQ